MAMVAAVCRATCAGSEKSEAQQADAVGTQCGRPESAWHSASPQPPLDPKHRPHSGRRTDPSTRAPSFVACCRGWNIWPNAKDLLLEDGESWRRSSSYTVGTEDAKAMLWQARDTRWEKVPLQDSFDELDEQPWVVQLYAGRNPLDGLSERLAGLTSSRARRERVQRLLPAGSFAHHRGPSPTAACSTTPP